MFGPLGVTEVLFILVLALLVFGPRRLPELGRTIGRAMGEFRRASTELRRTLNNELTLEEEGPRRPAASSPPRRIEPGAPSFPKPAPGTAPRGAAAGAGGGEPEPAADADEPPIPVPEIDPRPIAPKPVEPK